MTATVSPAQELTPLADYLGGVLRRLRALPARDCDLTQAHGNVLAKDVLAPHPFPAFDQAAIDGYACRSEDIAHALADRPARLSVVGDLAASSWRPARLTVGTCFSVAAGAPLPAAADVVVPLEWTDQDMASVEIIQTVKRGFGTRRIGEILPEGAILAKAGGAVTPALVGVLAATGIGRVVVRPSPRVVIVSTGDELVEAGRASQPGQVVDVNSHALTAATAEAGAHAYRVGICDDDPEALRALLDDQSGRADLIITTGGSGTGPADIVRRIVSRAGRVVFTDVSLALCGTLGFGFVGTPNEVPIVCLPGEPGAALVGFEVLARPVIQVLSGADPVFRPSARGHLLETVVSPAGLREFRPAFVAEQGGGGYTVQPLPGGPRTLAGMAEANALLVLGERVTSAAAGSTVDVLLLDRRR